MQTTSFRLLTGSRETSSVCFEISIDRGWSHVVHGFPISARRRPT